MTVVDYNASLSLYHDFYGSIILFLNTIFCVPIFIINKQTDNLLNGEAILSTVLAITKAHT